MKANRKFLQNRDEAVSPVIAVILMVAITVVLAATVYVWVSGFGAQSSNPAKTMSITSDGAIAESVFKNYTVASATSGMKWSDVTLSLNGAPLSYDHTATNTTDTFCVATSGTTCALNAAWAPTTTIITAGQMITIKDAALSGQTLRILDANANSVMLTLTIG